MGCKRDERVVVRVFRERKLVTCDRQKASTRISEKSVGRCYCFCDSSVVASGYMSRIHKEGER